LALKYFRISHEEFEELDIGKQVTLTMDAQWLEHREKENMAEVLSAVFGE